MTRYASQFALALIGYFLVGTWTLLLIGKDSNGLPPPALWGVAAGICLLGIGVAIALRVWLGWRGFLAGALTGTAGMLVIAAVLVAFLRVISRQHP